MRSQREAQEQEGNAQINADTENIILSEVMDAVLDDLTEG